jgi:hypothetical protein
LRQFEADFVYLYFEKGIFQHCDKMMQLDDRLTGERLPNKTKVSQTALLLASDEGTEQLEGRLLEQLQAGNTHLLFPIGQFYFEQVIFLQRYVLVQLQTTCRTNGTAH